MKELKDCFQLSKGEIVSVIGSGGKSSLINYLANSYSHEKVLISTTTKMLMAKEGECHQLWLNPTNRWRGIDSGIVITGDEVIWNGMKKLQMPKSPKFTESFRQFDKVFLESDGSRGLPLKGWREDEPVILPETSMTIGVVPITAIGMPATEEFIHRLPLWLELIEETKEECFWVSEKDMAKTIANEKGLWYKAKGKGLLFINQVEDKEQLEGAKRIVELIPKDCKEKLSRIIVGSVEKEVGEIMVGL